MEIKRKILDSIGRHRPIIVNSNYVERSKEFEGKTALVIGGGSGIGKEIAISLFQSGARVIVAGRRKYELLEGIESIVWDVMNTKEIESHVDEICSKYDTIDMVINSQGICPEEDFLKKFYDITIEGFEKVIKTNLESVLFICQYFCKYFEKNGIKGHILNICSTEGMKPAIVPYGISKTGVLGFTQGLGKMMISKGIVVNGISPGATFTKMMRINNQDNLRLNYIPSQRMNTTTEVAMTALFLLGDTGNQMCGQVVVIDGGESL